MWHSDASNSKLLCAQWVKFPRHGSHVLAHHKQQAEQHLLGVEIASMCRDEIAECSERAYSSLSIPEAKRLMLFSSDREVASYAEEVHYMLILKCIKCTLV